MLKIVSENFIHALLLFLGLFLKISRWVPLSLAPTLENVRVTEMFESQLYACSFLVHVVQSVLQWGKDPIVIVKREENIKYKATRRTNQ